ncbi:MAG: hypothetical protein HQ483_08625 [Rhodospirillales bacterium]|nr:hypothetical protein [Rhodospirillales bacterium]
MHIPEDAIKEARETGHTLIPVQGPNSKVATNQHSIYYLAEHLIFKEGVLPDAFETLIWFQNETRLIARWICGTCFIASIMIFLYLVGQGLNRIVF